MRVPLCADAATDARTGDDTTKDNCAPDVASALCRENNDERRRLNHIFEATRAERWRLSDKRTMLLCFSADMSE